MFAILGSTYTGHYEPVEEIHQLLDEYDQKTGIDIPIHVDAASGGFIAPFAHAKVGGPKWNFERVLAWCFLEHEGTVLDSAFDASIEKTLMQPPM